MIARTARLCRIRGAVCNSLGGSAFFFQSLLLEVYILERWSTVWDLEVRQVEWVSEIDA